MVEIVPTRAVACAEICRWKGQLAFFPDFYKFKILQPKFFYITQYSPAYTSVMVLLIVT